MSDERQTIQMQSVVNSVFGHSPPFFSNRDVKMQTYPRIDINKRRDSVLWRRSWFRRKTSSLNSEPFGMIVKGHETWTFCQVVTQLNRAIYQATIL